MKNSYLKKFSYVITLSVLLVLIGNNSLVVAEKEDISKELDGWKRFSDKNMDNRGLTEEAISENIYRYAHKFLEGSRLLKKEITKMVKEFKGNCDKDLSQKIEKKISTLRRLDYAIFDTSEVGSNPFSAAQEEEIMNIPGYIKGFELELYYSKADCSKIVVTEKEDISKELDGWKRFSDKNMDNRGLTEEAISENIYRYAHKFLEGSRLLKKEITKMVKEFKGNCDKDLSQKIEKKISTLRRLDYAIFDTSEVGSNPFSAAQEEEIMNIPGYIKGFETELHWSKTDCANEALIGIKHGQNKDVTVCEKNWCRDKADIPNDTYLYSKGSWRQKYDDQWAIKHIGFTTDKKSAWNVEDGSSNPVVVAVIDTGLDWNHKDINWENIWKNTGEIPDNGKDDDGNGYVDDVIGWNFIDDNNKPWDHDGHGTFVSGIIAAASDNKVGIAGINKGAKIMVLKGLNAFGHGRASSLAESIFYAADNGAQVINISAGGKHLTQTEQDAVNYAYRKGAVIIVAAGNEAMDTEDYSPSGLRNVIAVGATDLEDKRASFSNWGQTVDISAPGVDVLSLRARRTDFMLGIPDVDYKPRSAYVGQDRRYFRASGTSFSAPMVAATASLILAKSPKLTNKQVERMLLNSARDIEVPGWDQLTGYGLLDARAALKADPNFYALAKIKKMAPARKDGKVIIQVIGTADSSDFKVAWAELGFGEKPEEWKRVGGKIKAVVKENILAEIPASEFNKKGKWSVKLVVETKKHGERFGLGSLDIQ